MSATAISTSPSSRRRGDLEDAAALHGMDGVDDEVDERHLELVGDALDAGKRGRQVLVELHPALQDLVVAQLQAALDHVVDVELDRLLLGGAAEGEQALGQAA